MMSSDSVRERRTDGGGFTTFGSVAVTTTDQPRAADSSPAGPAQADHDYPPTNVLDDNQLTSVNNDLNDSQLMTADHSLDLLDFLNSTDDEEEEGDNSQLEQERSDASVDKPASDDDAGAGVSHSMTLSIINVVIVGSVKCHLSLKDIARKSVDVEYRSAQNHLIMRLRRPYTVATIWSSGKLFCTGAVTLENARLGARCVARRIQKCGYPCKFSRFQVVNIMARCNLPFRVRLDQLVKANPTTMNYEPELAPGLNFLYSPKSTCSLKLFSTGRMVLLGRTMEEISASVAALCPLAVPHRTDEPIPSSLTPAQVRAELRAARNSSGFASSGDTNGAIEYDEEEEYEEEEEIDNDLEESQGQQTFYDSYQSPADSSQYHHKPAVVQDNSQQSATHSVPAATAKIVKVDPDGGTRIITTSTIRPTTTSSSTPTRQGPSPIDNDSARWSKKSVASGSGKRACIVSYSGKEEENEQSPPSTSSIGSSFTFAAPSSSLIIPGGNRMPYLVATTTTGMMTSSSIPTLSLSSLSAPQTSLQSALTTVTPNQASTTNFVPAVMASTSNSPFIQHQLSLVTSSSCQPQQFAPIQFVQLGTPSGLQYLQPTSSSCQQPIFIRAATAALPQQPLLTPLVGMTTIAGATTLHQPRFVLANQLATTTQQPNQFQSPQQPQAYR